MTERRADDATREVADWLKCEFMQDHVGSEFTGVISSVTNFGLFVRLDELQIDGMIHVSNLGHEYFHFDGAKQCLIGEHSHTVFRLGDKLNVVVASVSLDDRRINLALAEEGQPDRYARRRSNSKKPGKSVREQLKAGSVPGAKKSAGRQHEEEGSAKKKRKKTTPKGELKKGKSATLRPRKGQRKKETQSGKAKRPGKNARKRDKS